MHMFRHEDPASVSIAGRNRKFLAVSLSILSGIALVSLAYFCLRSPKTKPSEPQPAHSFMAELVTAKGVVLVRHPGKTEWRQVKSGAKLVEGDSVRTDIAGEAEIRYQSGTSVTIPDETVFTVRDAGANLMEISAPPGDVSFPPPLLAADEATAGSRPWVELQQIIRFGMTLELIGRVEPGSRLVVNNRIVEVAGDGAFKHFTQPFPASAHVAQLRLKVTDLAGRSRVWTATHNFNPHGGEYQE